MSMSGYLAPQEFFVGPTVVEIAVPSGKLIASDDLRMGPLEVDPQQSLNYGAGLDAYSQLFSKYNVAYAFVGNTCPKITRNSEGLIQIVSLDWNKNTRESILTDGEVAISSICTDVWATMITDYDFWLACGGKTVEKANEDYSVQKFSVIEVTPGKYRWTVYSHADDFDSDASGRIVFAKLELINAY